jgi:hypothetical protein
MKGALLHCAARRILVTRDTPALRGYDEHFAADGDASEPSTACTLVPCLKNCQPASMATVANAASLVTVAAAADTGAWVRLTIRTLKSRLSTVYPRSPFRRGREIGGTGPDEPQDSVA